MDAGNLLGFVAGTLTTACIRPAGGEGLAHALDPRHLAVDVRAVLIPDWCYGWSTSSLSLRPIVVSNIVTLALALTISLLKLRYK